jgi:hypothetical protein
LQTWCKLMKQLASSLQMSICSKPNRTTCSKYLMNASMLMQVEKIRLAASCHLQTWCKLFHQLMQVVSSTV